MLSEEHLNSRKGFECDESRQMEGGEEERKGEEEERKEEEGEEASPKERPRGTPWGREGEAKNSKVNEKEEKMKEIWGRASRTGLYSQRDLTRTLAAVAK